MLRIVSHLEHLLRLHDCVVIPQLGGFVLQAVPASYVAGEHLFYPMHKEIVFNPSLKHTDGLLPGEYMNAYSVSFPQALRMVKEDVEDIKALLFKELKVSLGNVGTLRKGEEGNIVFQPGDSAFFSVSAYGLSPFQLKEWELLQREQARFVLPGGKKNTYYISIIRGIAASAAAVALFLMISTPVKEVNLSSYTASFIPSEIAKTTNRAKPKTLTLLPATTTGTTVGNVKTTTSPSSSSPAAKPKVEKEEKFPMYYVIIGSVKTREQADELIAKVDRTTLKYANKLVKDDKVRIYANKFTDKSKAEIYLAKIRQNTQYKDAWLYTRNK
ncbi:MAG: SPOR domain-containing protein [Tannerellaceae bacterium]|nr:SPOR domain-containing protein [Tannerellaceae bacterium]